MNYRDLLKKYMELIYDREGLSYLNCTAAEKMFTDGEIKELKSIDSEIRNED